MGARESRREYIVFIALFKYSNLDLLKTFRVLLTAQNLYGHKLLSHFGR